jgi:spore coat protein A
MLAIQMIDRRQLLEWGLVGAVGAVGISRLRLARADPNPWGDAGDYGHERPATFASPLPIPPELTATASGAEDHFEMTIRAGATQALPGATTPILGFEGVWPGPVIRATRGRTARVRVKNELASNISVHNHGMNVAATSDGHPLAYIRTGETREYVYPNNQAAGTYWYHDHAFGQTAEHVYRGLAGFYLIHDPAEDALGLPSGAFDVPIVLQDRVFDGNNALVYNASIFTGVIGDTLCVNGVHTPHFEVATRRYRFRFLNGSNSRTYQLALQDGSPLVQIASDGNLLAAPLTRKAITIAPAERCDVVIDFSGMKLGTKLVLKNLDPTWPTLPDVMRFEVRRREDDPSRVPAQLATIERLDPKKASKHRKLKFEVSDGKWTINGLRYDPARIDFRPKLGSTEIWEIKNAESSQTHPFHQHLVPFQVLDVDGAPPAPELMGWKDVVPVGPGATVRIIMRFTGFTGVYVLHCHKLEHEDHAMMLQQEVVK